jgi:ABC-type transport system involved in multi-copper enzyme maturation permease subunit
VRNLLRRGFSRHGWLLLASTSLLAGFQFLICAALSSVDVAAALGTVLSSLPPLLREVLASQLFGGFTSSGLLAFGWNHPVAHALGAAVPIVLAATAVAGESETGAMELLLRQPISRRTYFVAQIGFSLAAILVVSAGGVLGTVIGQGVFGMERFGTGLLVRLALNYAALQTAVFSITLLLSAGAREGGPVATIGFLVVLASYFAQVIGSLWPTAAFVLPWTLHQYFSPQEILVEHAAITRPVTILAAVAASCLMLAWARFRTRGLP